jgi:hypothetical protein
LDANIYFAFAGFAALVVAWTAIARRRTVLRAIDGGEQEVA